MSDSLIPFQAGGELSTQLADDMELLKEVSSGGEFLPYLQLFTTKSDAVTEGKIGGGHYGLVRDGNITDLGKELNVIVVTVRARAYEKADDGEITVVYDKTDPEYVRIQALQAEGVQGCMAGPEFLFWIPDEKTFATFFCGSKTLKREARKFNPFLGGKGVCNMRVHLIDNGKYKWHGPVVNTCSAAPSALPSAEDSDKEITKFKNPPKPKKGERVAAGDTQEVTR
jgi:hypothetical protein